MNIISNQDEMSLLDEIESRIGVLEGRGLDVDRFWKTIRAYRRDITDDPALMKDILPHLRRTNDYLFKLIDLDVLPGFDEWIRNPNREHPPEVLFGVMWSLEINNEGRVTPPLWEVSWIANTGELYAHNREHTNWFILLGIFKTREEVDQAMCGWDDSKLANNDDLYHWAKRLDNITD